MIGHPGYTVQECRPEVGQLSAVVIADVIKGHRYSYACEDQLQGGIAAALVQAGLPVQREVPLTRGDRIDLLVGRCGVEVKITGRVDSVLRQLQRYATSDQLDELLLVTTRACHQYLPEQVGGKPATVLLIGGIR